MNRDVPDSDGAIRYYDGDYPSLELDPPRADAVQRLAAIGLLGDVAFYRTLAEDAGGPVLEIGCGTGRLAIPMARAGATVWGVDASPAMLARLTQRLAREPADVRARVILHHGDALALPMAGWRPGGFPLVLLPFNLLMLQHGTGMVERLLAAAAAALAPGGRLALDVMNPLALSHAAERSGIPSPPLTDPWTGAAYLKITLAESVDAEGVQRVHGWYEEPGPAGTVTLTDFAFRWRMIPYPLLESRLAGAGLVVERITGDFDGAPWRPDSRRIVVVARRSLDPCNPASS